MGANFLPFRDGDKHLLVRASLYQYHLVGKMGIPNIAQSVSTPDDQDIRASLDVKYDLPFIEYLLELPAKT